MKRHILACIFLLSFLSVEAQVKSSHDGFYTADSLYYQLTGTGSFKYCVNCYSADSLHAYTGGVWLYSREHVPNTWENSEFSKSSESGDTNHMRPDVVKANTIWVRIFNDTGYIDQHHLVFLGNWRPKTSQAISIFIDSSDFMGPRGFYGPGEGMPENLRFRWNYLLKIEKTCSYQVYAGRDFKLEAEQTAGIEVSANYSATYADKAMQLNANRTPGKSKLLLPGKSLTDTLGPDIKILRLRVGGANHQSNIIANEIATEIIRPDMGGERSTPVSIFINGSFWTYAMAEEGMGPNHISKIITTDRQQLMDVRVPLIASVTEIKRRGIEYTQIDSSLISACGFTNACQVFYVYNDTMQFEVDTTEPAYKSSSLQALCYAVKNGSDSSVASEIDRETFYRYALSIWFFQNPEGWARRLVLSKPGAAPWKVFAEHYDFEPQPAMLNDWDKYFTNFFIPGHSAAKRTLPWQATKRMYQSDRNYFCLVFEDELNTTYKQDRIVAIAQKKIASLRPCVSECSKAWWPKGWIDSVKWEKSVDDIVRFLRERPSGIANALPRDFMTGADTLWTETDMNKVDVIFDSISLTGATVKLNSLELKSNFSGKYYPRPELRAELNYDGSKYKFVGWKEYPKAPSIFYVSANKHITLTPILKPKKT